MNLLQAIVLGIVQGLAEFIPISSTAHLKIVPVWLGWQDPGAAFTAVIQCGTLAAVLAYFRGDIIRIARAWMAGIRSGELTQDVDARMGWLMILGTIPIVVAGLLLKPHIETSLRSLYVISAALMGLALLLAAAEGYLRRRLAAGLAPRALDSVGWTDAIVVGLAQAMALVPGVSRSGVTITGSLFRGMSRDVAARFSFLLSLPAVFAAGVFELVAERHELLASHANASALVVSTVVSGVVGYGSIAFLLGYLKQHTTLIFIVYRLLLGAILLAMLFSGALVP